MTHNGTLHNINKIVFTLLILVFICSLSVAGTVIRTTDSKDEEDNIELTDDWQYSAEETHEDAQRVPISRSIITGMVGIMESMAPSPVSQTNMTAKSSLGFAVGGAKDTGNFLQNLENSYLPKYDSLTYEGLFYDYYFDTGVGSGTCRELFCPSYARAVTTDIYSGETDYYLSVGLNSGLTEESFQRKKLNIVVVLDISGSMDSRFDRYYYDASGRTTEEGAGDNRTKMQLANESIVAMMDHLDKDDRFGVVLFDNQAYQAKPLRPVAHTDMKAIARHILDITPQGGTNWQSGYEAGVKLFNSMQEGLADPTVYENRIIFLTDAMPNQGELGKNGLFGMVRNASVKGIYTSFIGIGVDFNPKLVEHVTKTRGANYYSVHSAAEFKRRMADEFDFMVTPLVFDLELRVTSNDYTIDGIYGSPEADLAGGEVMKINTLFPSAMDEEQVKGGVVLIKLRKTGKGNGPVELSISYKDRSGKQFAGTDRAVFDKKAGFDNKGIRKAVLLSEYVSLIKNWLIDANKGCNDQVERPIVLPLPKCGLINPQTRPEITMMPTWERRSCPLEVSAGYRKFFTLFSSHFREAMKMINDTTLEKEFKVLALLTGTPPVTNGQPIDDWQEQ